jgi:hypothetical protein
MKGTGDIDFNIFKIKIEVIRRFCNAKSDENRDS